MAVLMKDARRGKLGAVSESLLHELNNKPLPPKASVDCNVRCKAELRAAKRSAGTIEISSMTIRIIASPGGGRICSARAVGSLMVVCVAPIKRAIVIAPDLFATLAPVGPRIIEGPNPAILSRR